LNFRGPKSFCSKNSRSRTHPSIRQAKHSKLDPASCRQMDAARRFSFSFNHPENPEPRTQSPEKIHPHWGNWKHMAATHKTQHKMLSCAAQLAVIR